MTRILVDIPEKEVDMLNAIAKDRSVSRAALMREAVQHLIKTHKKKPSSAFGILKGQPMIINGVEYKDSVDYIRKLREEWDDRFS
jgi:metal-responsive CopG/Arc/MetJ family transcriptional regulator